MVGHLCGDGVPTLLSGVENASIFWVLWQLARLHGAPIPRTGSGTNNISKENTEYYADSRSLVKIVRGIKIKIVRNTRASTILKFLLLKLYWLLYFLSIYIVPFLCSEIFHTQLAFYVNRL